MPDSYPSAFAARNFHGTLTFDGRNFLGFRRDCSFTKLEDLHGFAP